MNEFRITERTEPFTLEEICDFIDTTNASKLDRHELKSMIADCLQAERNKAIDDFAKKIKPCISKYRSAIENNRFAFIDVNNIVEQLKEKMKGGKQV